MEARNMGTETTITNLPQMVISGKEVEKELSREQIVEKVHNFLKCCQTELSSMAKERILSMNSISNGNEDVDDNEEMISIVENSIESNIDDDSNRSPYYLTLFLKILKRVFYEQCSENSPYSPSFWGENLSIVEKFISVSGFESIWEHVIELMKIFSLLQLATNKVRYPAPSSSPLLHIYWNQEMLLRYIIAKELEANIADAIGRAKWSDVYSGALKARHIFLDVDIEYRFSYMERRYNRAILAMKFVVVNLFEYLTKLLSMLFSRCISHGIEALQRQRKYKEAVDWLQHLLNNKDAKMFLMDARGSWWDRLALNLDSHLKQRDEALKAINAALEDPSLGDKDRLLLQCIVWDETSYECAVEEIALRYYLRNGYKEGVHAEGAIWHTVFGLLCYDIIFDHQKEDVWFCETQVSFFFFHFSVFFSSFCLFFVVFFCLFVFSK
uniref:Fanconi-associated nuclease n=1 Tax=Parascaris equorum TaxID=6256 RepID=A0A914RKH0_PAREQ